MVNEQIVIDTVKRMIESGIDSQTIASTLADIGIDESQAKNIIKKVENSISSNASSQKNSSVDSSTTSENSQDSENESYDPSEERMSSMRNELETQAQKSELHESATHNLLNEHGYKLDEMGKKVDAVHNTIISPSKTTLDSSVGVKLSALEEKVEDISAQTTALLELMKKILETDRNILTQLESKK
jgi:hypothetical protein